MIDSAVLKRLLTVAAALLLVSAGASLALGAPLSFAAGLGLGYLLGAVPVASWAFVAPRILMGQGRTIAIVLLALKMGFYGAALYFCVYQQQVSPVGILAGMTGFGVILVLGLLLRNPAPAKEAA